MPLDVQLSLLTAGGVQEPSAEWTETATQLLAAAISDYGKARGIVAVPFDEARLAGDEVDTALQLVKLHGLVGRSITVYQLSDGAQLPTKADSFDWSLGPQVEVIGRTQQADYALFIFLRDSYASGGRVAATVLGAMVGVALPAPAQIGFASVVDLKTGNVARFNLVRRLTGNVRTPEGARETVQELLKGLRE
jgi:phage-related tail protein